jgi:prepilin-type N-terminal cleavage/methylation domain-containing protein
MRRNGFTLKHSVNQGFTLIEVMLVLSLMAMTTGFITTKYITYNQRQKVTTSSLRLVQVFKEAKANAVAGKIDCTVCGGADHSCDGVNDTDLTGWQVVANTGANPGYTLRGVCGANNFNTRTEIFEGVTLSTTGGSNVIFNSQGGTGLGANLTVNFTGKSGFTGQIIVTSDGEIK